tara:strand:+ start:763 stop:1038 length:276 start_codon:yes stop_codon:yes gene_type:complete
MKVKMGQIIKINFTSSNNEKQSSYEKKLIKIRDEIEDYLDKVSIYEKDELAVALAAGRYAAMKLAQLTGEKSTKQFINDCIKTTLRHKVFH